MEFLAVPSLGSLPKKQLWEMAEFSVLDQRIADAHRKLRDLGNHHAHVAATEFVDKEVEWEAVEPEVLQEIDGAIQKITEGYAKIRRNLKTAFSNIVRGVDFGLVDKVAQPLSNTTTPKVGANNATWKGTTENALDSSAARSKFFKRGSVEDVTSIMESARLVVTQQQFGSNTASVVYHVEEAGKSQAIVTGSWGVVYAMDLDTYKAREMHLNELRDFGKLIAYVVEVYNCQIINNNVKVMLPYKSRPAVYWEEMYCFSLPSVFQSRFPHQPRWSISLCGCVQRIPFLHIDLKLQPSALQLGPNQADSSRRIATEPGSRLFGVAGVGGFGSSFGITRLNILPAAASDRQDCLQQRNSQMAGG